MSRHLASVAFLDRDGTINVKAPDGEYIHSWENVKLLPGAARAVRALNDAGTRVAVVTNQRGIALGRMTADDLAAVHARLAELLHEEATARLDVVVYCPHDTDACLCRKPLPGMLEEAARQLGSVDRTASVMIGDSATDVDAGLAFGVSSLLLGVDAPDLDQAVRLFLTTRTNDPAVARQ